MSESPATLNLIDLIKVVASQIILWHHFALYGPMSDVVNPAIPVLDDILLDHGPLAVKVFLVISGFLAAHSLMRTPATLRVTDLPRLAWLRYRRLAVPLMVALCLALGAARLARTLIEHPTIPAAPTLNQLLAHLLLLQDISGHEALSAGVWYVAIDFQLFCLFSLIATTGRRYLLPLCAGGTLLALFWFNRMPALDMWAPYFFGAYGLGILAHAVSRSERRGLWLCLIGAMVIAALVVDWRSRILVAGISAAALALTGGRIAWALPGHKTIARLSELSYAVFLLHYPVLLAVGAVVHFYWPGDLLANAVGLLTAWGLSLLLAQWLTEWTAGRPVRISSPA